MPSEKVDILSDIARRQDYETHGTLAEMTAERDSWRRVAERLEREKVEARNQLKGAVEEREAMYEALVAQLGSHKLAEIAFQRRLEAKRADAGGR